MSRPIDPMTEKIETFIRMEARGESYEAILKEIFGYDPATVTQQQKANASQQMYRWRHRPDAQAIWEDEIRKRTRKFLPLAMTKLEEQLNSKQDWIVNKAINDMINLAKASGVFTNDNKDITVHIEGMPEIGSPEQEE